MSLVKFKVISLDDARSHGSEMAVGNEYSGEMDESGSRVFYTDKANDDWVFYVGDSCEIVNS